MSVKYVYAAMLLHSAGQTISEDSVKKVLGAAGAKVEEARIKALVAALSEVKIDEVLKNAATMVAAPAAPAAPPPGPAEAKAEAKEDKKKEEEALAGLGALFG